MRDIETILLRLRADLPVTNEELDHARQWVDREKAKLRVQNAVLFWTSLLAAVAAMLFVLFL